MIKTVKVDIDAKPFFGFLVKQRFKKKWYGFLLSPLAGTVLYFLNPVDYFDYAKFLWAFGAMYPAWVVGYYYYYANSDKTKYWLSQRTYEFNGNDLTIYIGDEQVGHIQINKASGFEVTSQFLVVFQADGQFIYIPSNGFENEDLGKATQLLSKRLNAN
ncbi:MAG: hypothetical protein KDC92_03945 [Bacteroidetes bacterium]|nr:hypothetical protein [Bacteroidota bacterium]